MTPSDRIALAGVFVSFIIGTLTFFKQRKDGKDAAARDTAMAARDLLNQIQEERNHAQRQARETLEDLDAVRQQLRQALDQNSELLDTNRDQARKLIELTDSNSRLDNENQRRKSEGAE